MTDPTDLPEGPEGTELPEAPLSPEQDAAVRRALGAAGGAEPMPGEIADRLDAVLAGLAAERVAVPTISHAEGARVVHLDDAARLRRNRGRALLAAAAVVVAGAIGAGIVTDDGGGSGGDSLSTAEKLAEDDPDRNAPLTATARPDDAAGEELASSDSDATVATPSAPGTEPQRVPTEEPLREVRPGSLREDLVALQHLALPRPSTADYSGTVLLAPTSLVCQPAAFGAGYLIGVQYDGKPAVVAFRQPAGSTQVAEVLACGTGDVLHSTTLPVTG